MLNDSLEYIASKINSQPPKLDLEPVLIFNPLAWERSDAIKIPIKDKGPYIIFNKDGKELPAQTELSEDGKLYMYFKPDSIPALGWKTFYMRPGYPSGVTLRPLAQTSETEITVENALVRVVVDRKTGLVTSLFDKTLKKEFIKRPSFKIMAFIDHPMQYTAWNIADDYLESPVAVPAPTDVRVDAEGGVFARVYIERKGDPTSFKQWITVYNDSPMVEMITYTDMHWHMTLVKVEFNTTVQTEKVASDIPYAVIERSTHPKVAWDAARTEMPCQKWTDLSNDKEGVALVNFGKYGFSLNDDGAGWRMSIVKAAKYPKPIPRARKVNTLYDILPTPDTDQGDHWAQLAIMPHAGNWREAKVYKAGYEYNTPVAVYRTSGHTGDLPSEANIISLNSGSAYIADLKKAEDDDSLVVRVVESAGKDTTAILKVGQNLKIADAAETDLVELNPKPLTHDAKSVSFPVGHFEIKTIKIKVVR